MENPDEVIGKFFKLNVCFSLIADVSLRIRYVPKADIIILASFMQRVALDCVKKLFQVSCV